MKLSDWARTAWRWFKSGKLPVPARQLPSKPRDGRSTRWRRKLLRVLKDPLVGRFGFEMRLCERRSARSRARKALEVMGCG